MLIISAFRHIHLYILELIIKIVLNFMLIRVKRAYGFIKPITLLINNFE